MRSILFQFFFFFKTLLGFGQQLPPQEVCILPIALQENSGMIALSADSLLFINDSGNPPIIYLTDTTGAVLKETYLTGFPNVDWEDLTYDKGDRVFIGDFGNNLNNRKDLRIGICSLNQILSLDTISLIDSISFNYARQDSFPALSRNQHFDVEAMVYHQDSLYLFSKNRTNPFDGKVYQYSLPAQAGMYNLSPQDSFVSGQGLMLSYWIAAASYQSNTQTLLLMGYDKLWRFDNSIPPHFFGGQVPSVYSLNSLTQKEALDFVSDSTFYLSDEQSALGPQRLYKAYLVDPNLSLTEMDNTAVLNLVNNKVKDNIQLELKTEQQVGLVYEIFSVEGARVQFGKLGKYAPDVHRIQIDVSDLAFGGYVLNVLIDGRPNAFRFVRPYQFID